jgi:hypothetical protein
MSTPRDCKNTSNQLTEEKNVSFDWGDHGQGEIEEMGLPWEGAVVYKRNSSISHVEYCTTLERLGLGEHSTEISKSRASIMGLRVTKAVKDYPHGTPVQISIDITRKRQKLRLDGIIRTVITLGCNRYSNLLNEFNCLSQWCFVHVCQFILGSFAFIFTIMYYH